MSDLPKEIKKYIHNLRQLLFKKEINRLSKGLKKLLKQYQPEEGELVEIRIRISRQNGYIYSGFLNPLIKYWDEKEKVYKERYKVTDYKFNEKTRNGYKVKLTEITDMKNNKKYKLDENFDLAAVRRKEYYGDWI